MIAGSQTALKFVRTYISATSLPLRRAESAQVCGDVFRREIFGMPTQFMRVMLVTP